MLLLCVANNFNTNVLHGVVALNSHNCGILSRKGCDNYLKMQENCVKNKKFYQKMKKKRGARSIYKKKAVYLRGYTLIYKCIGTL